MAGGGVTGSLTVTFASEDDAFTEGNGAGDDINPSQPTRINHDKPRSAGTMAHPSCGTIVLPSTSKKSGHAAESIGQIVKGGHFVAVRFNPGRKTSATFVYMAEVISVAEEQDHFHWAFHRYLRHIIQQTGNMTQIYIITYHYF
ncbi:uncharacterized protein [Apostichopus japonicus]|uniref:uncharacterized protein n=1 Tax=Stichopus japonicus TaxID=307972 RepID=UPI003AB8F688